MGSVYLIGDYGKPGWFKIGATRGNVEKRLKKLQTGNGGILYIKSSFETNYPFDMETMLHEKYKNNKMLNEWYFLEDNEVEMFEEYCVDFQDILTAMEDNYFFKKKHNRP